MLLSLELKHCITCPQSVPVESFPSLCLQRLCLWMLWMSASCLTQLPFYCYKYREASSIMHWFRHSVTLDTSPGGLQDWGGCDAMEMRAAEGGMAPSCSPMLSSCEKSGGKLSQKSPALSHASLRADTGKLWGKKGITCHYEHISFPVM